MHSTPQHAARVLGLSLESSLDEVRAVRRKMALRYHPDCSDDQERATRHMARINAAADTLMAYLKDKSTFRAKASRARHSATQRTWRPQAPKSKPAQASSEPRAPKAKAARREPEQHAVPTPNPSPSDKAWKAERALARFATESYASILNGIGRTDARPTVDIKVLNFATAA